MFRISDEFETYGYRRLGAALRQQGLVVNHKKLRPVLRFVAGPVLIARYF